MEVEAQAIGRDDEEHLELLSISLIDAPLADLNAIRLNLVARESDVGHKNGRTVLAGVATVDGEAEPHSVTFHDDGRRVRAPLNLRKPEHRLVEGGRLVKVLDGKAEDIIGERVRRCEQTLLHDSSTAKGNVG